MKEMDVQLMTDIRVAYDSGLTIKELGEKFGHSPTTIRNAIVAAGGVIRPKGRRAGFSPAKKAVTPLPVESMVQEDVEYTSEFDYSETSSDFSTEW